MVTRRALGQWGVESEVRTGGFSAVVEARSRRRRWEQGGGGSIVIGSSRWQSVIAWVVLLSIVSTVLQVVFAGNQSHVGPGITGLLIEHVTLENGGRSSFVSLSTTTAAASSSMSSSSASSSSSSTSSVGSTAASLQQSSPSPPTSVSAKSVFGAASSALTAAFTADSEKEDGVPCKVLCFAPTPVCGEDGITYWCGPKEAECAGVKVDHENACALGNGVGTGSAFKAAQSLLIQSLLIVHFVWLVIVGLLVLAGRT